MSDDVHVPAVFLVYAFRYALGRRSYAVADVAQQLIANRDALRPDWRAQIVRDIADAITLGSAGMACDIERWQTVAQVMAS